MSDQIRMELESWRGYSAYEIAKKAGFSGSEEEWLASLKGRDGGVASVNGVAHDEAGNVQLTGEQLTVSSEDTRSFVVIVAEVDKLTEAIKVSDEVIDVGGKYIDNARFR